MKKQDLLAYIGIALTIPGVGLLFLNKATIVGTLILIVVVILFVMYWLQNRPPFTILEADKTLDFQDEAGNLAFLESRVKIRANHMGITQFWFRGINADGTIENIKIDGDLIPPHLIKRVAGSIEVYKQFNQVLTPGKVTNIALSYELHDSFLGKREGMTHVTSTQTKRVKIRINFHQRRPASDVRHYLGYGSQVQAELEKPAVPADRLSVECQFRNPKPGSYHTLEWDW